MRKLDVYSNNDLLGQLTKSDASGMVFEYAESWLNSTNAHALSESLPLTHEVYSGQVVYDYFNNLLPEGVIRAFIEKAVHISRSNVFGLLERFGGDTAGSLSFVPEGQQLSKQIQYLPVSIDDVRYYIQNSEGIPLRIAVDQQSRMSISGAQKKVTLHIDDNGKYCIPLGETPSTYIIKPSIESTNLSVRNSAINEVLCMQLAKAIGFNVADAHFSIDLNAAVIKRFDRIMRDGQCVKLHQEDFAQAMALSPHEKYEDDSGNKLDLKKCFAMCNKSHSPLVDIKRLYEWTVFNAAIGNLDGHAKNIAFLEVDGVKQLSPFYDLMCTRIYPDITKKLALKIGGQSKYDELNSNHWNKLAKDIGLKPATAKRWRINVLNRVSEKLPDVLAGLKALPLKQSDAEFLDTVGTFIAKKTQQMTNDTLIDKRNIVD